MAMALFSPSYRDQMCLFIFEDPTTEARFGREASSSSFGAIRDVHRPAGRLVSGVAGYPHLEQRPSEEFRPDRSKIGLFAPSAPRSNTFLAPSRRRDIYRKVIPPRVSAINSTAGTSGLSSRISPISTRHSNRPFRVPGHTSTWT